MTRRWDGWGDADIDVPVPDHALELLVRLVGTGRPPDAVSLATVAAALQPSRVAPDRGRSTDPEDRIRHARGQSLADWIALRSGRLGAVPDAVARPTSSAIS